MPWDQSNNNKIKAETKHSENKTNNEKKRSTADL